MIRLADRSPIRSAIRLASAGQWSVVAGDAPVNTVAPVVTGSPYVGQTLTADDGTWTGTEPITYTYQWYRDLIVEDGDVVVDGNGDPVGEEISGATNSTYVLTSDDLGEFIAVLVTATNAVGEAFASSADTAAISFVTINSVLFGTPFPVMVQEFAGAREHAIGTVYISERG